MPRCAAMVWICRTAERKPAPTNTWAPPEVHLGRTELVHAGLAGRPRVAGCGRGGGRGVSFAPRRVPPGRIFADDAAARGRPPARKTDME